MKNHIKSVVTLTAICAIVAILMGVTNYITAPIIAKRQSETANEALLQVFPDGEGFEEIDISLDFPKAITRAYSEENGGYVFEISTTGYSSGFVIMCGVDKDGKVTGATYIASNETNGAEKTYGEQLKGKTLSDIDSVDTVAGSTKTTAAYRDAVKTALGAKEILGGGTADLRSEEEKLADNLSAALPVAEGKFAPYLITEQLTGNYSVYKADNGSGFVFVSGENFIGADSSGNITSQIDESLKEQVLADVQKLAASSKTEIDITKYAGTLPAQVQKAYMTASGNYVLNLRAAGYGITGGNKYHPASGEYIYIDVALTPDGKILSCITVSQAETEGVGDACAKESYYSQFVGKTSADYTSVDAISGATVTSNAYAAAIAKAFEAVNILKGGA